MENHGKIIEFDSGKALGTLMEEGEGERGRHGGKEGRVREGAGRQTVRDIQPGVWNSQTYSNIYL